MPIETGNSETGQLEHELSEGLRVGLGENTVITNSETYNSQNALYKDFYKFVWGLRNIFKACWKSMFLK